MSGSDRFAGRADSKNYNYILTEFARKKNNPEMLSKLATLLGMENISASNFIRMISSNSILLEICMSYFHIQTGSKYENRTDLLRANIEELGIQNATRVISCQLIKKLFEDNKKDNALNSSLFITNAVVVGEIAGKLAEHFKIEVYQAYISGFIHKIGMILMHGVLPNHYSTIASSLSGCNIQIYDFEKKIYGYSNLDLGKMIAVQSHFPQYTIGCFDLININEKTENVLARCVWGASFLAHKVGFDCGVTNFPPKNLDVWLELNDIPHDLADKVSREAAEKVMSIMEEF